MMQAERLKSFAVKLAANKQLTVDEGKELMEFITALMLACGTTAETFGGDAKYFEKLLEASLIPTQPKRCEICGGTGKDPQPMDQRECDECGGTGFVKD